MLSSGTTLPDEHPRDDRFAILRGCAIAGALAIAVVLGSGCGSRRALVDHPDDSTATPTTSTTGTLPAGMTLGERLGQLDALMRTAPADSLPILRDEYDRLLAERTGEPGFVRTGGPSTQEAAADTTLSITVEQIPTSSDDAAGDDIDETATARPRRTDELVTSDFHRDQIDSVGAAPRRAAPTSATTPAVADPSRTFKGLRPSEIATIPGHERASKTSSRRNDARRTTARTAASRASTARTAAARAARRDRSETRTASAASTRASEVAPSKGAAAINGRGERKALVEGIAAARAGRYADAVTKLEPAVRAGRAGSDGNYYYALALEKSGQVDRAASQYLRASRAGGPLAQRSYLEYCRLLARSGDRRKARELLTQFLRRNPDSTQAVAARRLLQTL